MTKKLAFCFLIYDIINFEELWNDFFSNVDHNKYNVYIHYKNNIPLKYFEKYKLNNCINTKYGHVSLIHAQNMMFNKAFEDIDNYKFIMISNSCIPLKNFNFIYDFLTNNDYSYFNENFYKDYCISLKQFFDNNIISKASQWCILNRNIIDKILKIDKDSINNMFETIWAPEEVFYLTYVRYFNMDNQCKITKNTPLATTFTHWGDMDYKYKDKYIKTGLKNYNEISEDELEYLLNSNSLFGRKFTTDCTIKNTNRNIYEYLKNKLISL